MEAYAGIDLHSSNSYIGVLDEQDQRHFAPLFHDTLGQCRTTLFFQAGSTRG